MRDIETKISPIISGLFPSFYQEEGPNFIAFVKAYYEWLEQNFQLLDLESTEGFNVGDTITQENVTGTIFAIIENSALVLVDGLETFKCFNVCSEIIPITSSSGSSTFILRGGTAQRLGSLFLSRNILNIRDIDKTLDLFVLRFKEKYLKNIEFDTQTNKRLLVKNSLDLYRAKGTSRAIDLFFRLIYGVKPDVYYPGDDLFRLSDAEWFVPQYIEINSSSSDRAISLVGKQISGVDSSATAFVERYVKKKVNDNIVHLLYVSNVKGAFIVGERIKDRDIFDDSPIIVGSLTDATIVDGSELFNVGDIVNIEGSLGDKAVGRVTAVVRGDGRVTFELEDSGWGFTTNLAGGVNNDSTNTFISDKIITIANATPGAFITDATIVNAGNGYNNTDIITINAGYQAAKFRPTTNNSGSITSLVLLDRGNGYFPDIEEPFVGAANSGGTGLLLNYNYDYPKQYFRYLENFIQPIFEISYINEQNPEQFIPGDTIILNDDGMGSVIDINTSTNTMRISAFDNHKFFIGESITRAANAQSNVEIAAITSSNTTGLVIETGNTATLTLGPPSGVFNIADTLFQTDSANNIIASGTITNTSGLTLIGGKVEIKDLDGVFRPNQQIRLLGKTASANLVSVSIKVAVTGSSNTFTDTGTPFVYSALTGIKGLTAAVSSGINAQYKIASIDDAEQVFVNTDRLNNTSILQTSLSANAFNLPANTAANLSSIIYNGLSFTDITIGSIATLGQINPGTGYNSDPATSTFQPNITGYRAHDYIMTVSANNARYFVGEYVTQPTLTNITRVTVADASEYRRGEKVHAANSTTNFVANGIIRSITLSNNTIVLGNLEGNIPSSNTYTLKSLFSGANSTIEFAAGDSFTTTAKGIVKSVDDGVLTVKRIQLKNNFEVNKPLFGQSSGSNATLRSVILDLSSQVAGLNSNVKADAAVGEGTVGSIQIVDSGYGFSYENELTFTGEDNKTGIITPKLGGVGTSRGFYRNTRGFVSDLSKVHDGDYYQEYSYDIISRIPLDRYSEMFKKVMHAAGTRFFGSVLLDSLADISVTPASSLTSLVPISSIEIANNSPFVVEDREDIDVVDRKSFFIEIREF